MCKAWLQGVGVVPFRISRQVEQIPYLPSPLEDVSEYEKFQPIAYGWQIKSDWPREYKHDFKMRVSLRPHESGNPNHLLRGDGKYIGDRSTAAISGLSVEPWKFTGTFGVGRRRRSAEWVHQILSGKGTLHEGTGPRVEVHHRQTGRR